MYALSIAVALHALAAVVWVGGMAFAWGFLRPAAGEVLDAPARLALWRGVFTRFFPVVWVCVALLLVTGYYMVLGPFGGFAGVGGHVHAMHGIALLMTAIFAHLFFAPWRGLRAALDRGDHAAAASALDRIRRRVAVNLALGLLVVLLATGGRYWY